MRTAPSRTLLCLAVGAVLRLPAPTLAAEGAAAAPEAARRAIAAFDAHQEDALASIATAVEPDPWLVLDALEEQARVDVARALARAFLPIDRLLADEYVKQSSD